MIRNRVRLIFCILLISTIITIPACGPTQYNLNISVNPESGGTVTPGSGIYEDGTIVNIIAEPASGYRFDHWSGNITGTINQTTITMDSEKNVTAHFIKQFALTVSVDPVGSGTVTPSSGIYDDGGRVNMTAESASGYRFDYWSGDITGTINQSTITIDSEKTVIAHFKKQLALTVSVEPEGSGTITPSSGAYDTDSYLTLTANPAKNYMFVEWSGDAVGTSNPITITMNNNKNISAHFEFFIKGPLSAKIINNNFYISMQDVEYLLEFQPDCEYNLPPGDRTNGATIFHIGEGIKYLARGKVAQGKTIGSVTFAYVIKVTYFEKL
jgi:hypothetical protein